jgi:inner membrane protein
MDNATHAFAGLLMADATTAWIERRTGVVADKRLRRAVVGLGVIAAELPDADLLYSGPVVGMGKLGYLLHHRGHTHTIVFAVAAALMMWLVVLHLRKRVVGGLDSRERTPLLVLALAGTLSHLLLDFTNSYGVHPFWPLDNRWVYGDSVFIVEPWIWVVAIPPLLFGPRARWSRVLLSLLLVAILAASWTLGELTRSLALVLTVGAALSLLGQWMLSHHRRIAVGVAAWLMVEGVFAVSSQQAKRAVRASMPAGETLAEVIVSPGAGNPLCFDGLIVSLSASRYVVRGATIAPWSSIKARSARSSHSCRARAAGTRFGGLRDAAPSALSGSAQITWGDEWTAPRGDLAALAAARCEMAAALHFYRVPVWSREDGGAVNLSDLRFGVGTRGFSDLAVGAGACSLSPRAWIPPWTPPRTEALQPPLRP